MVEAMDLRTANLLRERQVIRLVFPTNDRLLVQELNKIPYLKQTNGAWETPYSQDTIALLKRLNFVFSNSFNNPTKTPSSEPRTRHNNHSEPFNEKLKLYNFQKEGVQFIEKCRGRALIADEMGLGKTVQALAWLKNHQDFRPVLIICPASLKMNWQREIYRWMGVQAEILSGTTPRRFHKEIVIINYDILPYWVEYIRAENFTAVVVDECFPAGTKIQTPKGNKNIEELKVGDVVYNATGIGYIKAINSRTTNDLIRIHLNNNTFIDVTPNHPFFTEIGWVCANELKNNTKLFCRSNIFNIFANNIRLKKYGKEKMCSLRGGVYTSNRENTILRNILFSEMENVSAGNKESCLQFKNFRKNKFKIKRKLQTKSGNSQTIINTYEIKQPFKKSGNNRKNQSTLEKIWTPNTTTKIERRKWETTSTSTKSSMGCFRATMENGISNTNKKIMGYGISDLLQSGYSTTKIQNLDRSRRMVTRIARQNRKRQKERNAFGNVRVERIEILKSRNNEQLTECTVYNLQVSGHPSYYANEVLVHNCHYIKNNSAKRTKAFKRIVKTIPKLVALSGTPIENKPVEIYNIVQAINPLLFPNFILFAHEYCGAKKTPFGWDFSGATNSKKLHNILKSTIMIRRKKIDVLSELPPKHVVKVSLKIDNKTEYKKAENEFIRFLQEKFNRPLDDELKNELKQFANRHKIGVSDELTDDEIQLLKENKFEKIAAAPILAQIEILKQLAIKGKLKQITDWIEDFLESGEKLVVFGIHRKTVDFLFEKFPTAVKIDGSTSQIQRQKAVDRFQTDPNVKLFIGNIRAAGVGITLTAASNAAIIEFPWSPGELVQASDRIHRITQTKQVTIYNLVGAGTIEERIIDLLKAKSNVISQVLDGRVYEDKSILMELINIYRRK